MNTETLLLASRRLCFTGCSPSYLSQYAWVWRWAASLLATPPVHPPDQQHVGLGERFLRVLAQKVPPGALPATRRYSYDNFIGLTQRGGGTGTAFPSSDVNRHYFHFFQWNKTKFRKKGLTIQLKRWNFKTSKVSNINYKLSCTVLYGKVPHRSAAVLRMITGWFDENKLIINVT